MMKFNGREYKWWVERNAHVCGFCRMKGKRFSLGEIVLEKNGGKGQWDAKYWPIMFQTFKKHVKEYHPEVKITK